MANLSPQPVAVWNAGDLCFTAGTSWLTMTFGGDTLVRVRGTGRLQRAESELHWALKTPLLSRATIFGPLEYDATTSALMIRHNGRSCQFPTAIARDVARWLGYFRNGRPDDERWEKRTVRSGQGLEIVDGRHSVHLPREQAAAMARLLCRCVGTMPVSLLPAECGWEPTRDGMACFDGKVEVTLENHFQQLRLGFANRDQGVSTGWSLTRSETYQLAEHIDRIVKEIEGRVHA